MVLLGQKVLHVAQAPQALAGRMVGSRAGAAQELQAISSCGKHCCAGR